MDIQRAQEIIDSPTLINVNYRGTPVFIKEIHVEDETATVFPLQEMDNEQVVELYGLTEENPLTIEEGSSYVMNSQRAVEISESPDMKYVTYNGEQVYIQNVDEKSNTARIFPLGNPQNEFDVDINSLRE